jgi:hypothetical protein
MHPQIMRDHSYASPRSRQGTRKIDALAAPPTPRTVIDERAFATSLAAPPSEERAAQINDELRNLLGTPVALPGATILSPHVRSTEPPPEEPKQKPPVAKATVDPPITLSLTAPIRPGTPPSWDEKEWAIVKQVFF